MRFDIMTLFPDMVEGVLSESIIGRAAAAGIIKINTYNIRDYTENRHRRVDDTPYGGGMGMLMSPQPVCDCYDAVRATVPEGASVRCVYMSPKGKPLTQEKVRELSQLDCLIILCGHYEGIDQRALDIVADEYISVGDYVLTGGELPACILVDAVSRLIDGVLASPECYETESLSDGLLEYPQYTRPPVFRGVAVPEVLLSGHHGRIDAWRAEEARRMTERLRPDLLAKLEGGSDTDDTDK